MSRLHAESPPHTQKQFEASLRTNDHVVVCFFFYQLTAIRFMIVNNESVVLPRSFYPLATANNMSFLITQ